METKKVKLALFKHVHYGFLSVWTVSNDGTEREVSDYCRLSEWIEVDFPLLPADDMQARKQREIEAARERLQKQLAALDTEDSK